MLKRVAAFFLFLLLVTPLCAQNQRWEIEPKPDASLIRAGKVSVIGGLTSPDGVRFVINNLDIMQPIAITLAAVDASQPIGLAVYKDSPQQVLLSKQTDASGAVTVKFRTQDSVQLMVTGPAGAKYQLMAWVGPTVEVATPSAFVPIDAQGSPMVTGVAITPPAATGAATQAAQGGTTLQVPTSVTILLGLILVALVVIIVVLMRRGSKGKGASAAILVAIGLLTLQQGGVRAQQPPSMDLAPKTTKAEELVKALKEGIHDFQEKLDTLEKMGIKVEPEAIHIPKPGEEKKEGGGEAPSFINASGKTLGQFVTNTKLILAFLEEFGLIDPREAAVQPNYNPPGQPLIPSRCAGTGQCGACFNDANAKLEKSRKLLEDMYVIYKQTELKAGRIHELANAAAGLSPYAQLAWTAIKNNPNEGMNVAQRRFYDTYDTNLEKLLQMANEGLIGVGACERENFKDYDWYPRYGMIYYNFLKERYTRK